MERPSRYLHSGFLQPPPVSGSGCSWYRPATMVTTQSKALMKMVTKITELYFYRHPPSTLQKMIDLRLIKHGFLWIWSWIPTRSTLQSVSSARFPPASWLRRSCNPQGSHKASNEHTSPSTTEKGPSCCIFVVSKLVAKHGLNGLNSRDMFIHTLHYVCLHV